MQLAEISVQKINPDGEIRGRDGLKFMNTEERVRQALLQAPGKALLVFDGNSPVFADAACSPRTIGAVFDGDCLPLFSMPDTVSCVLGAGEAELLHAARYFAEVRDLPCILFPAHASLAGVFEAYGEVILDGEKVSGTLRDGEIVCDCERLLGTLPGGFGRIVLSRLAAVETGALNAFDGTKQIPEVTLPESLTAEEIILANAGQRVQERNGAYAGEGAVLSDILRHGGEKYPEWRAFLQLSALYAAFFEKGKPRRYFTPDYHKRAARAGALYPALGVPSAEEYAFRALTLERIRARFIKDMRALLNEREKLGREMSALAGEEISLRGGDVSALQLLPEHARGGLSSIIRDFGLMEW